MASDIQILRAKIKELREKRKIVTMEKGIAGSDVDLRENGAFIAFEDKEFLITTQIESILAQIKKLTRNEK